LESIPGIGEKTVVELLKHFRSLKRIKEASKKDLEEVAGVSRASIIYNFYHSEK
jgi:excinuclease ABC subunit C